MDRVGKAAARPLEPAREARRVAVTAAEGRDDVDGRPVRANGIGFKIAPRQRHTGPMKDVSTVEAAQAVAAELDPLEVVAIRGGPAGPHRTLERQGDEVLRLGVQFGRHDIAQEIAGSFQV